MYNNTVLYLYLKGMKYLESVRADGSLKSYNSLPASSEESHYEYIYYQDTDDTGYLNPMALNTDDVKYATIKDDVVIGNMDVDNVNNTDNIDDRTNYLELIENMGALDT